MTSISFEDALRILEHVDFRKAEDYRTVIAAVERLPLIWHRYHGDLWKYIIEAYKEAAIVDAIKVLSEQYLSEKMDSASGRE